jgi:hypothetical protein
MPKGINAENTTPNAAKKRATVAAIATTLFFILITSKIVILWVRQKNIKRVLEHATVNFKYQKIKKNDQPCKFLINSFSDMETYFIPIMVSGSQHD